MKTRQYIRILAEFVTGEIDLSEFKQAVEERLFDLRQKPDMTEEKKLLSSIELHLHEAEEGQRTEFEVYAHVQSILDSIILPALTSNGKTEHLPPVVPKIPYLLSQTFDIDLEPPDKEQTVTRDLPLVASK